MAFLCARVCINDVAKDKCALTVLDLDVLVWADGSRVAQGASLRSAAMAAQTLFCDQTAANRANLLRGLIKFLRAPQVWGNFTEKCHHKIHSLQMSPVHHFWR